MAGATTNAIANNIKKLSALDGLVGTTNLLYNGLMKVSQISFDGAVASASRLASVMKEIANTALDASMNTEVRIATLTQKFVNKKVDNPAAAAGAVYQRATEIRGNSLLEENDIYDGLGTMIDLGYKADDKVIQQVVDIAEAKNKSMAEVANVFKLLKSGDTFRGLQGALDLGVDIEKLRKNDQLKGDFGGFNNMSYTGDPDQLYQAVMEELGESYAGVAKRRGATLSGTWGTIKLRLEQIYLKALGFNEDGQFQDGTIFAKLKDVSNYVSETLGKIADLKLPNMAPGDSMFQNIGLMFESMETQLTTWYKDGGKQKIELLAYKMGKGLAKTLMTVFGIKLEGEDQNIFVAIGKSIASSFWSGFKEEFKIGEFIQSTLGKAAVVIGGGLIGALLGGPGGAILGAVISSLAVSFNDEEGTNPLSLISASPMQFVANLIPFMNDLPNLFDIFSTGLLATSVALFAFTKLRLFKGGLIPNIYTKYFKKDVNYSKEIYGKLGEIIRPLDAVASKMGSIIDQLDRIIKCACDKCDCDDMKKGKLSNAKDKVKGQGKSQGGELVDEQEDRVSRREKHKKRGFLDQFKKRKSAASDLVENAVESAADGLLDSQSNLGPRSEKHKKSRFLDTFKRKKKTVPPTSGGEIDLTEDKTLLDGLADNEKMLQDHKNKVSGEGATKGKAKSKWYQKLPGPLKKIGTIVTVGGVLLTAGASTASAATPDGVEGIAETGSAIAEATSSGGGLLSSLGEMLPDLGSLAGAIGGGEAGSALGAAIGTMIAPGLGTGIGGILGGLLGSIVGGIFGEKAVIWMQGAIGSITGFLSNIGTIFSNAWTSIVSGVSTFGINLWTGLTTWLSQTWTSVTAWVSGIWTSFTTWLGQIPTAAGGWMMGLWTSFTTWLSQLWIDAGLFLSNIAGSFGTWFKTAYDNAVQWVMGLPDAIAGFIASIPERIGEFVEGIGAAFLNLGSTIINSIRDGIVSSYEKVGGKARWVMEKAMNGFEYIVGAVGGGNESSSSGGRATGPVALQYHGGGLVENEGWAILKRKEMVLDENLSSFIRTSAASSTGQVASGGSSSGTVNIQIGALANTLQVREEADVHNIAAALSNELKRVLTNQGVYSQAEVAR